MKSVGVEGDPNLEILTTVVDALGDLCDSLVFVGGCATGLLLTEARAELIRATDDVDVVAEVATVTEYHRVEKRIAARGFRHDQSPEAPLCRWTRNGIKLDVMPKEEGVLGFHNRWYPIAVSTSSHVAIPGQRIIRLISAPLFVATKLEAFRGRGRADYMASHDLEDILTVVDGRPELIEEVARENIEVGQYIRAEIGALLQQRDFVQALPGHLPADSASQARVQELLGRLKQLAASKTT